MSCSNPSLMEARLDNETGAIHYLFLGSAMYADPKEFGCFDDVYTKGSFKFIVPCGKCDGCRIDYAREWSDRMVLELCDSESAIFCTLTYNNDSLPISEKGFPTLCKRDCQLFFKRLRKHFDGKKLRYYICGEYGANTFRPHYHAIIYGLSIYDFADLRMFGFNELRDPYFTSKVFENIWSKGFVMMSDVNYKTCSYVSRYCLKKVGRSDQLVIDRGIEPEFNLSSRFPGIGLQNALEFVESGFSRISVSTSDGVHEISIPKTLIRNVKRHFPNLDSVKNLCYDRSKDAYFRLVSNLEFYDKSFKDFLKIKADKLSEKLKVLPKR